MLQGLYAAASGMEAQQNQLDAVANDLANVDTHRLPGRDHRLRGPALHPAAAIRPARTSQPAPGLPQGSSAAAASRARSSRRADSLDVAIQGPGYFEVRRQDGTIGLTRNGALQTNAKGQLTNGQGMLVQPPITIPPGTDPSNVTIQGNGNVIVNGKTLGQLKLVDGSRAQRSRRRRREHLQRDRRQRRDPFG